MINTLKDFDFSVLDGPSFKEDSVREEIIKPILNELGYSLEKEARITRSKTLSHPFVKTGSGEKKPITSFPDYLLEVNGKDSWVLDAKNPNENILEGDHVEQAYFYAIHPEVRVDYFALCNGKEFSVFHISEHKPLLHFSISEIEKYWENFFDLLAPKSFSGENQIPKIKPQKSDFDYLAQKIPGEMVVRKRAAKRHFGVHGYFTKQSWNIVQEYIKNFTQPGDTVFDPFGGSGVTAIEAMMTGRKGIHIDLNPMSVFLVKSLVVPVDFDEFSQATGRVSRFFEKTVPKNEIEVQEALEKYPLPKNLSLPKGSDVEMMHDLFSKKQMAELALLKFSIKKEKNKDIQNSLLLAFSSTINKINLTYHHSTYASKNAGDSGMFKYYRYRIAPSEVPLDTLDTFIGKANNVLKAKKEIFPVIAKEVVKKSKIFKGNAAHLDNISSESVDYIYTDPPYGSKIPYLDLSTMWNAWLDLEVTEDDFENEAIEGGEHHKTKDEYGGLIADSLKEMFRVLKWNRWMSFVFQHQDPYYWHLIVETAEKIGFEYAGSVAQKNGQTSFKKRQNPFTVLSGQLILNFKKVKNPKSILKNELGMNAMDAVINNVEALIAKNDGATLEEITNELIIRGLELGFLDLLSKETADIADLLSTHFHYDEETDKYHLRKNTKFRSHIPVELRIRYFIISFLKRSELEKDYPTFDSIVFDILPLLKNGTTPENQTIRKVLEEVADHRGSDKWQLKKDGQQSLFL